MDPIRFDEAKKKVAAEHKRNGIGTLSEKTLHAVMKNYFEPHEENHEIRIGGYVADIVSEQGIIEIQTRNFRNLKTKLDAFLEVCSVLVVYPVTWVKSVVLIDSETGEITRKRGYGRRPSIYAAFDELYSICRQMKNERLSVCVAFVEVEERRLSVGGKWRKRDCECDKIPLRLDGEEYFTCTGDYARLIPEGLGDDFTSADLAAAAKIPRHTAQSILYFLNDIGAVVRTGKRGNSYIYSIKNEERG